MLGDKQEAEDAVQDTFVNAFRSFERFTYGASYLPWLYRIATNVCLNKIRTQHRKGFSVLETLEGFEGPQADPILQLYSRRVVEALLSHLDERGQEILVLHFVDGMDQGQVGKTLGISRRAVVKRLTSIREQIKQLIGEEQNHD